MLKALFFLALLNCVAGSSIAAGLTTKSGQLFVGVATFDSPGMVTVTQKDVGGLPLSFPLEQIQSLRLRESYHGQLSGGTLPGDWSILDIGAPAMAGNAEYSQGEFTLRGEGTLRDERADSFMFVHHRLPADFQMVLRVKSFSGADSDRTDLDPLAATGIHLRRTPALDDPGLSIAVTADRGVQFITRLDYNRKSETKSVSNTAKIKAPCWLKMVRTGTRVNTSYSMDGKTWLAAGEATFDAYRDVYVGAFATSHRADQLATAVVDHVRLSINGIEAKYYADARFKELRLTRILPNLNFSPQGLAPDPSMPESNYTIRFSGQLLAPNTDQYNFYLPGETAARMYINNKLILDTGSKNNKSGIAKLQADARYEIRIDYAFGDKGTPNCRLLWASSLQPQPTIIPNTSLFYAADPVQNADQPDDGAFAISRVGPTHGVILSDGTFLQGTTASIEKDVLHFSYRDKKPMDIPLSKISWVIYRAIKASAFAKVPEKGKGVLTAAGDFMEGDCNEVSDGKAKLSSVLFGIINFDLAEQVGAILFREATAIPHVCTIHTTNGSSVHVKSFKFKDGSLVVDEPILGEFEVKINEITTIEAAARN